LSLELLSLVVEHFCIEKIPGIKFWAVNGFSAVKSFDLHLADCTVAAAADLMVILLVLR